MIFSANSLFIKLSIITFIVIPAKALSAKEQIPITKAEFYMSDPITSEMQEVATFRTIDIPTP